LSPFLAVFSSTCTASPPAGSTTAFGDYFFSVFSSIGTASPPAAFGDYSFSATGSSAGAAFSGFLSSPLLSSYSCFSSTAYYS